MREFTPYGTKPPLVRRWSLRYSAYGQDRSNTPAWPKRDCQDATSSPYAIWAYHRFALSLCGVEDFLAERCITVRHETIRDWVAKFGTQIAAKIRRERPQSADKWHLDEVVVTIRGKKQALACSRWQWRHPRNPYAVAPKR
tara:strand:+ start:15435 stop:15857 length:423 start_codon:yes stop_codon:yes gene_type:complete